MSTNHSTKTVQSVCVFKTLVEIIGNSNKNMKWNPVCATLIPGTNHIPQFGPKLSSVIFLWTKIGKEADPWAWHLMKCLHM